jgi:hypothetical protein
MIPQINRAENVVLLVKRLACGREEFLGKSDTCCSTQQARELFQNCAEIPKYDDESAARGNSYLYSFRRAEVKVPDFAGGVLSRLALDALGRALVGLLAWK